jgi:glycosyltransferase involved in cell wall biosynthesis
MTGGCHVAMDCDKYMIGCGACPQLCSSSDNDLSRSVIYKKKEYLSNKIRLVGISNWIEQCAKKSYVFNDNDTRVIYNNIEIDVFKPKDKDLSKADLGFDLSERIVLVGAINMSDKHKGSKQLVQALEYVDKSNIHLVSFGHGVLEELKHLPIKQTDLGYIKDEKLMARIYSSADVFVAPSLMDAFGKTLAEAQACGTPVVCFNATGPRDIVEHKVTGYKATPFEPSDLANGISWVLSLDEDRYEEMCLESRQRSVRLFDSKKIADKYESLYRELTK